MFRKVVERKWKLCMKFANPVNNFAGIVIESSRIVIVCKGIIHVWAGIVHVITGIVNIIAGIVHVIAGIVKIIAGIVNVTAGIVHVTAGIVNVSARIVIESWWITVDIRGFNAIKKQLHFLLHGLYLIVPQPYVQTKCYYLNWIKFYVSRIFWLNIGIYYLNHEHIQMEWIKVGNFHLIHAGRC